MLMFKTCMIYFYVHANIFLDFIRKIPVISGILPDNLFKNRLVKRIACVLGVICNVIKQLIYKSIPVYIVISLIPGYAARFMHRPLTMWEQCFLYIMFFCVISAIYQCRIFKTNEQDYMYLHHFMMNPDIYYRYKTMVLLLNQVLIQLPVLVYVFKGDIVTVGMLIAVKLFSVYFSGAVYVLWFKKSSRIPKVRARMLISAVLAVAAAAVFWMGLGNIVISGYVQLIIAVVLCAAGIISITYIFKNADFRKIAVVYAGKNVLSLHISISDVVDEGEDSFTEFTAQVNEKYYNSHKDMDMGKYLNRTLFYRLGKLIKTHYSQTVKMNIVLGIVFGVLIRMGVLHIDSSNVTEYSPVFISVVSNMTYARALLQLAFRNMDMPFLYNGLYLDKKLIKKGVFYRYGYLLKHDMITYISICINLLLIIFIGNIRLSPMTILAEGVLILSALLIYETFYFMEYYLIQPYSEDITIVSPFRRIAGVVEFLFSFVILFIRENLTQYVLPVFIFAIALIIFFALLVNKLVSKTFVLH